VTTTTTADQPVLELASVRAGYGRIDVLHGVNLALAPGRVYALLGPNGAGKSTTLAVASGQIVPSSGSLMMCGRDVTGVTADALARAGVCLIPEGRGIFPNLTVVENLQMVTFGGVSFKQVEERTYAQFPRLKERRTQLAGTLSGGEQQMLAIARALTTDPALLMLDEISMGLAPMVVAELYDLVKQIAASGVSILLVEQFARTALAVADYAAIMVQGRVRRVGQAADVEDELSSAYLGKTG